MQNVQISHPQQRSPQCLQPLHRILDVPVHPAPPGLVYSLAQQNGRPTWPGSGRWRGHLDHRYVQRHHKRHAHQHICPGWVQPGLGTGAKIRVRVRGDADHPLQTGETLPQTIVAGPEQFRLHREVNPRVHLQQWPQGLPDIHSSSGQHDRPTNRVRNGPTQRQQTDLGQTDKSNRRT